MITNAAMVKNEMNITIAVTSGNLFFINFFKKEFLVNLLFGFWSNGYIAVKADTLQSSASKPSAQMQLPSSVHVPPLRHTQGTGDGLGSCVGAVHRDLELTANEDLSGQAHIAPSSDNKHRCEQSSE